MRRKSPNSATVVTSTGQLVPEPWAKTRVIGEPLPRIDAYERVSGSATFTADIQRPGMLYGAILRCPYSNAVVKRVDTSAAEHMPGVVAVLSHADTETNLSIAQPSWIEGGPEVRLFNPHCHYAGEEVAAVAAENPYQASDALLAIKVDYEPMPFVIEPEDALKPGAHPVHEGGNLVEPPIIYERGDVSRGFAEADYVLEKTYRTSYEIHSSTEPHGAVAGWDGNRLTVWEGTQGVFDLQAALAQTLRLPLSSVRVISHYMGGGFGGKAELSPYTVIAALLARKSARPVKIYLTREELFASCGGRPASTVTLKAGVKRDGTMTALQLKNVAAVGAYKDSADVGFLMTDLYLCANVRTEDHIAYTNTGKIRAMRAPGFPQCAWALEQMMDELAEKIGMDPVQFRLQNIPTYSQRYQRAPYTTAGLKQCLERGAAAFGWVQARRRKADPGEWSRGVGVAACFWPTAGGPPATAIIKFFADGSVNLNTGVTDIGTGTKTVLAMVISEELGVPFDRIQIEYADTATTEYAQLSGGSKTVTVNTPAVRAAALEIRRQILEMAADQLTLPVSSLRVEGGRVIVAESPGGSIAVTELKELRNRQLIMGIGYRQPNLPGKIPFPFSAHFAEVEVNTRTGEVRVLRLLGAHDSGRVMNLLTYSNQVFGGMTMGLGLALSECRVLDRETGKMMNPNLHDYKVPTALDVPPEFTCLPVDLHDTECNTTGTKGLGEPATIPTAPAIANAVYHATRIRVTDTPISPGRLLQFFAEKEKRS